MNDESGLDLAKVREQWQATQQLMDDARARLALLATANESAKASASSIESALKALQTLSASHRDALGVFTTATESTVGVLVDAQAVASSLDLSKLVQKVEAGLAASKELAKSQESLSLKVAGIESELNGVASGLKALIKLVEKQSAERREMAGIAAQRDRALSALQEVMAVVPGRTRGKVAEVIAKAQASTK